MTIPPHQFICCKHFITDALLQKKHFIEFKSDFLRFILLTLQRKIIPFSQQNDKRRWRIVLKIWKNIFAFHVFVPLVYMIYALHANVYYKNARCQSGAKVPTTATAILPWKRPCPFIFNAFTPPSSQGWIF